MRERVEDAIQEATRLLQRLGEGAETGGGTGSLIEVLVLRALAHKARGDVAASMPLRRMP